MKRILFLLAINFFLFSQNFFSVESNASANETSKNLADEKLSFMQSVQSSLEKNGIAKTLSLFKTINETLANDIDVQILHSSLLLSNGNKKEAATIAENLLASNPQNLDVLELNAFIASQTKSRNKDSLIKKILAIDPYNVSANILQAENHFALHHYKLANASYKNALKKESKNVDALFGYAKTLFYMDEKNIDDVAESEKAFQKILELYPDHAPSYWYLGKIAAENKNYLRAAKSVEKALAIDKTNYDYYLDYGTYERFLGKYAEAENAWTRAIAIEPNYFLAYAYRGGIYKEQKKYNKALSDFYKVIQTNKEYYFAYEEIAVLAWHEKNWKVSREAFQKAYNIDKKIYYALMIAATFFKEKKVQDAKNFLQTVMRKMDRSTVEYEMARLLHDQGGVNAENALALKLDKIENATTRGKLFFYMGLYYDLIGSEKVANEYYLKILDMNAPMFFEYQLAEWGANDE